MGQRLRQGADGVIIVVRRPGMQRPTQSGSGKLVSGLMLMLGLSLGRGAGYG
jgi:hypothetical protein